MVPVKLPLQQKCLSIGQRVRLTNVEVIVHGTVAAVCVLRGLTIPGDVASHATQIIPAIRETTTGEAVLYLDLARAEGPGIDDPVGNEKCTRRPTPAIFCQYERLLTSVATYRASSEQSKQVIQRCDRHEP